MLKKDSAVALVSGGMDSCVTTAVANEKFSLALLHINYGQRTEKRELKAFTDIASYYGVPEERRLVANLDYFSKIGGSSLTDKKIDIPNLIVGACFKPAPTHNEIPTTYVPFRNAQFLSIAVSWAEVIGAEAVFIGAVEQDSPGYPDCRQVFYDAFNKLVEVGTKPETHIKVVTPLIGMSKTEIVKKGISVNAPLHLTWSCYKNNDVACGRCHSCVLRLTAFSAAGVKDTIPYLL
ncbi:MAG: 7-cyano-7-deazaguanine synthase QueC [Planctomycetes bacterium]|nr:7-cyano-7-deazaguanine synthase QueC [Planctomycetota bacterium]